jgi:hypothetical protein
VIFQVLVDLVHLQLLPSLEVLTADVAGRHLKVDLAVMVVVEVGAGEGHVTRLALLLRMVIVDVVLQLAVSAQNLAARLAQLALRSLRVNAGDVAVTLRLLCERSGRRLI